MARIGRRGIGDLIPTRGEGRALVEIKGAVGSKGARKMRRTRTQKPLGNTQWLVWNSHILNNDSDSAQGILSADNLTNMGAGGASGTDPVATVIQPGAFSASGGIVNPGIKPVKIHRMEGLIPVIVEARAATSAGNVTSIVTNPQNKNIFAQYIWQKIQYTGESTTGSASLSSMFDEPTESSAMLFRRDVNRWGHVWIKGRSYAAFGAMTSGTSGNGDGTMVLEWDKAWIPGPKLPIVLDGKEALRLSVQFYNWEPATANGGSNSFNQNVWAITGSGNLMGGYLPMCRFLISY